MAQLAVWPATHLVGLAEQAAGPFRLGFATLVIHVVNFPRGGTLSVSCDA